MASLLTVDVMALLTNGAVRTIVRKKAALCLLRLLRKSPPDAEVMQPEVWSVKLVSAPPPSRLRAPKPSLPCAP